MASRTPHAAPNAKLSYINHAAAGAPIIEGQGFEPCSHGSGGHAPHSANAKLKSMKTKTSRLPLHF